MKLYAIHHDRTRPEICGPLVSVGKVCSVLVGGVKKRVSKRDCRPGRYNAAFVKQQERKQ